MAKKFENKDFFDEDLFTKTTKDAEGLIKALAEIEDGLKSLAKVELEKLHKSNTKTVKGIVEQEESIKKLSKAQEINEKIIKDKIKLEKRLQELNSDSVQDNEILKVQASEQRKVNKQLAKEALGLVSTYQKQSKELNELRKRFKDVRLEKGKNSKEAKELRKELEELDETLKEVDAEAGQFQRSVGNYEKVNEGAKRSFGSLSGFLLGAFAASFTKSRDTAREYQGTIERVTNVIRNFAAAVQTFVTGKALPTLDNLILNIKKTFLEFKDSFTFGDASEKLKKEIDELDKKISKNNKTIDNTADAFANLGSKISKTDQNIADRLKRLDRLADLTAILGREIQLLAAEEQQLETQIGNSTVTFRERDKIITQLAKTQNERLELEEKLADIELENAVTSIKNDLIRRDLGEQFNRQQVETLDFLKDKNLADAISAENLQALVGVTEKIISLDQQRIQLQLENNKERLENARDLYEQELDFTLDIGDRQKSVRERIASDESESIKDRARAIAEAEKILDDSYEEQIRLTEDYVEKALKINSKLTGEEAKKRVEEINFERLFGLESEREIRKELIEAGITDENVQNRIREIIIERQAAEQDVAEGKRDLNKVLEEEVNLRTEIEAQRKALSAGSLEDFENLEKQRVQNQIENTKRTLEQAKQRLKNNKEVSIEILRLEKELNDLLIEEKRLQLEKELDLEKSALEKRQQLIQDSIGVISGLAGDAFADSISKIDDQLSQLDSRASELQARAAEGNLSAEQSLAEEEKKRAELEQKRERARKQQQQSQAFFTVLETYQSKVAAGDPTPLVSTIRDVAVLRGIAQSLGSFYEGTDDLGKANRPIDSKGGRLILAHDNEQIWSKKDRDGVGWRNRDEITEIVQMHDSGIMGKIMGYDTAELRQTSINIDNKRLETELKKVNRSIQGIKIPEGTVSIDEVRKLINVKMRKGNKVTTERSRLHD